MRISLLALSVFSAAVLAPFAAIAQSPGAPAPAFTLTDTTGKTVQLADYRGKYVVLEWTNPECPFVRKHYTSGNMSRSGIVPGRTIRSRSSLAISKSRR